MQPLIIRTEDGRPVAEQAWLATNLRDRAQGWLSKASAAPGEGLLIRPASSIHSFGMRFTFDLAFLDRRGRILKIHPEMRRGKASFGPFWAWVTFQGLQALELPAGTLAACGLKVGQTLILEERA